MTASIFHSIAEQLLSLDFVVLYAICTVFWVISHYVCLKLFELSLSLICARTQAQTILHKIYTLPPNRLSNLRRLFRSFLYCVVASIWGAYLYFTYYPRYPDDLLFAWSDYHYLSFTLALGHWTFCLLEDYWAGDATHAFSKLDAKASYAYRRNLVRHHLTTMLAYGWCLKTHLLSALCVFGLLFELPVVFITYRELIYGYDDVLGVVPTLTLSSVKRMWLGTYICWHLTRTFFSLHYPWSLIFWRGYLRTVPGWSYWVYHFLGIAFNYANWNILFTVLAAYNLEDARRFGLFVKKTKTSSGEESYVVDVKSKEDEDIESQQQVPSGNGAKMAHPKYMTPEELAKLSSSSAGGGGGGGCPFKHMNSETTSPTSTSTTSKGMKLLGPRELRTHNTSEDCWICIRGKVYNLTSFLNTHPGGREILLQHAGTDATDAFNDAQHSTRARSLMSQYLVAEMLPHGYDQSGADELIITANKSLNQFNNATVGTSVTTTTTTTATITAASATTGAGALRKMTAEERKELKRLQAEADAKIDDVNKPFHFMNRYFSWFDPVIPTVLLPLVCVYAFTHFVPAVSSAASSSESPTSTPHTLTLTALSIVLRLLAYASVLLLLLSNHTIQHVIIPQYGYFWVPASWIGAPSSVGKSVLQYIYLSLCNPRGHVCAVANVVYWTTLVMLLCVSVGGKAGTGTTLVRVVCACVCVVEFVVSYLVHAVTDTHRPSYFYYFRPLILCKHVMDAFENLQHFGVISLAVSVLLDLYRLIANDTTKGNIIPNVADAQTADMWTMLLSPIMGTSEGGMSARACVLLCVCCCATARVVYTRTLRAIGEVCSDGGSDSFGAVALTTPLSVVYACLWLWLLTYNTTTDSARNTYTLSNILFNNNNNNNNNISSTSGEGEDSYDYYFTFRNLCLCILLLLTQTSYSVFVQMSSHSFASNTQTLLLALLLWTVTPSIDGGWWSFFWFFMGIHCLGRESSHRFHHMGFNGTAAPAYWYRLKEVEEKVRYYTLSILYWFVVIPILNLMTWLAPYNNRFWAAPGMVVDIPNGEYGVAMMLNPPDQREPSVFQCNIGYMTSNGPDLVGTVRETQEMLRELATDPQAGEKGFVTDMVVVFQLPNDSPAKRAGYEFREFNFSAWADEKSAYDWYKNSAAHKRIVQDYYNAGLHSFSALLARLKAPEESPLRWEVRCTTCRKMVLGPKVDICPYCNEAMNSLPYV